MRFLLGLLVLTVTHFAVAQPWPAKPVRLVVPFATGGTADLLSRLVGERLGATLGQSFIVENRPGAGGNIGTELVAKAPPDGYTLEVSGSPTHAVNPSLYRNLPFDAVRDFTQIALLGTSPNLLVVNPSAPVHSVSDLVKLAREKPGELAYSTAGPGTSGHLAAELLGREMKVQFRHVPYKGQADAITGAIRGDVAFSFVTVPATLPHVKAGRLRALGITSLTRSPLAPDLPTVAESGVPDFEVLGWYAMYAPRGLPRDIVERLTTEVERVIRDPTLAERLAQLGVEPKFMAGGAFARFSQSELEKWGRVIRAAGVSAD